MCPCKLMSAACVPYDITLALPDLDGIHFATFETLVFSVKVVMLEGFAITGLGRFTRRAFEERCTSATAIPFGVYLIVADVSSVVSYFVGQYGYRRVPANFSFELKLFTFNFTFTPHKFIYFLLIDCSEKLDKTCCNGFSPLISYGDIEGDSGMSASYCNSL